MSLLDVEEVPRRTMVLIFMIDQSGSMKGSKIAAVNDAIRNIIPVIRDISDNNPDAEIKIAAMRFSTQCDWVYDTPQTLEDFQWLDIQAEGLTSLGEACLNLNAKLSRKGDGFMQSPSGCYAPVVILLSDGGPTDNFDAGIKTLRNNNWFKSAIKLAIAIGDDADRDVLKQFTGTEEAIFDANNPEALKLIIRCAAVTSSQIGSKSSSAGDTTKQEQVIKEINEQIADAPETATTTGAEEWE